MPGRRKIPARYRGSCGACARAINVGDPIYSLTPYGWVCGTCARAEGASPPTPAEVLTKITRDLVLKASLSVTNQQVEALLRVVRALAPEVEPERRPIQELPPDGRWFNSVTGWYVDDWSDRMEAWEPERLIGYLMDALADNRNTNLNKGGVRTLLRFLEDVTGWPFLSSVGRPVESIMQFRDDAPPLDRVPGVAASASQL